MTKAYEKTKRYLEKHKHPCVDCGKLCGSRAKRCKACSVKYQWQIGSRNKEMFGFGENALGWKGGRYRTYRGYIYVYQPNHPRAEHRGYVMEHILVWEQANAKPLPNGWVIHHLNGIKDDNRIRNLVALPNKKHNLILAAKAKRIQELEAVLNGQAQLI